MKQYRVTRNGSYMGVYCDVGDIITIKGKHRWNNSRYSGTFVGDIWSVAHEYLELIGDVSGKTDIEIKIDQMWKRQPYYTKRVKREPWNYYEETPPFKVEEEESPEVYPGYVDNI